MRRSLLAIFRGTDGRSLVRALVLLLALNALVAGLHGGALAAMPVDAVLCSVGAPDTGDGTPPADHPETCCLAGCTAPVVALPSSAALILRVPPAGPLEPAAFAFSAGVPLLVDHGPRGPPSFA